MRRTRICKFEEPNSKKSVGKPTIHYERVLCCPRFEPEVSLYQWRGGSRMVCGPLEGVMQLLTDPLTRGSSIEVKVRGPRDTNRACFFFLEELLGIVDQVGHIFHTLLYIFLYIVPLSSCIIGNVKRCASYYEPRQTNFWRFLSRKLIYIIQ